jgi:hypothetical protein
MKEIVCRQGDRLVVHYRREDGDPLILEVEEQILKGLAPSYSIREAEEEKK